MKVLKTPEEMSMKIKWTKKTYCPNCGAFLEYNNTDVKNGLVGPNEIGNVLICGHCNKWFEITE
jgi:uncharacterized protein YbaR (Trm112 family)